MAWKDETLSPEHLGLSADNMYANNILACEDIVVGEPDSFQKASTFGKNRVHRLQYLHEPKCYLHPCHLLTNRDALGIMFHPSSSD